MFNRIPRRCSWTAAHEPHETPTGFFDTAFCDGVEWLRTHKHRFILAKNSEIFRNLRWRCDCGYNYAIPRSVVKELLTDPRSNAQLNNDYRVSHWQ